MKTTLPLLCLLALSLTLPAQDRITRVEPANWWVGMEHRDIQLLVYGDDIHQLQPVLHGEGMELQRTIKVQNPNYLFLYVRIAPDAQPGTVDIEFREGEQTVYRYPYALRDREAGRAEIAGFDASDVLYLVTPDRFANGDTSNDNIAGMQERADRSFKGGRHGGDMEGMRQRLDYIADMGFTAIWMNPVLENDMPRYSYHGYAATDFYRVDPRFGSNEEYRNFVAEARDKGIKIIMDIIVNHSGSEHWFVQDPPTDDWINFQDDFQQTTHRRNTVQDIHAAAADQRAFSDGWFVRTMPDLNQRNALMADYLIQNTLWWIEYAGISGIRMDTYPYPDKDFMSDWTCAVLREYPGFNIVGEEWTTNPAIVSYWQGGKENHDGYTSCLPSLMDFPLQDALVRGLTQEERQYGSGLIETYKALTMDFLYADPQALVIFPDNHDMARFYTQVGNDLDLWKQGMLYYATMRGIPQIYYGTEILMDSDEHPGDHGLIRSDFPGGWPGDAVNAFTGAGLRAEQQAAQDYLRRLLNWRKDKAVIHKGRTMHFTPQDGVYVYFRYRGEEQVMVVLNKNEAPYTLQLDRFAERLQGQRRYYDVVSEQELELGETLSLAPRTGYVLERR